MKKQGSASLLEVCMVCYPYSPSKDRGRGLDRYIFELLQNLPGTRSGMKLHTLHQGLASGVMAAGAKLLRLIADLLVAKADVYHAMTPIGGATAALLGKAPLVVSIHDMLPFNVKGYDYSWKLWYMRVCTIISTRKSDAIIVPYEVTKTELISRFNVKESKIHVVNYGVDHSNYHPVAGDRKVPGRVLYIGEVSRSKGVDALIRAFTIVKKRINGVELLIGGKRSKDTPWLEVLCREMGPGNIAFLGYIPEDKLRDYYSSATVMVFPSRSGFGLSTLEAMACGTPVVVGSVFDAPEFVGDGGILVHPDDIKGMATNILRVLTEPEYREMLSKKAIDRAKAFSWERTAQETADVYTEVTQSKSGKSVILK
ncbi:MAG: glycosyltransferase family 4 protein [Nitrospirae bacterium]|nr:glycosyltransferase family 4 protein [Nitrospirota bacterium]